MKVENNPENGPSSDHHQTIAKIQEGIVIDHILASKALLLARILKLQEALEKGTGVIIIGLNLPSKRMDRKDIIKIAPWKPTPQELEVVALVSPTATLNIIQDYKVSSKGQVHLSNRVGDVISCPDKSCITHYEEVPGTFDVLHKSPITLRCHFCETIFYDKLIQFK